MTTQDTPPRWHTCQRNSIPTYDCPDCHREAMEAAERETAPTPAQERRAAKLIRDLERVQFAASAEPDERRVAAREANALRAALPKHNGHATRDGLDSAIQRAEEVIEDWGW